MKVTRTWLIAAAASFTLAVGVTQAGAAVVDAHPDTADPGERSGWAAADPGSAGRPESRSA
jgi:hypothetical protein